MAVDLGSFDCDDPAAFYLGPLVQQELETMADVLLMVEGTCLPAHSQVLQCNSRVLCAMFADVQSACKRVCCGAADEEAQSSGDETTEDREAAPAPAAVDQEWHQQRQPALRSPATTMARSASGRTRR